MPYRYAEKRRDLPSPFARAGPRKSIQGPNAHVPHAIMLTILPQLQYKISPGSAAVEA
jgi:hypothetical protein